MPQQRLSLYSLLRIKIVVKAVERLCFSCINPLCQPFFLIIIRTETNLPINVYIKVCYHITVIQFTCMLILTCVLDLFIFISDIISMFHNYAGITAYICRYTVYKTTKLCFQLCSEDGRMWGKQMFGKVLVKQSPFKAFYAFLIQSSSCKFSVCFSCEQDSELSLRKSISKDIFLQLSRRPFYFQANLCLALKFTSYSITVCDLSIQQIVLLKLPNYTSCSSDNHDISDSN